MVQSASQNGRRKRGPATFAGRRNQIKSRLEHGIRSRTPILIGLESEASWRLHWEGYRHYYHPAGKPEEDLVELMAYQMWCWRERLIPYEVALTDARIRAPDNLLEHISAETIKAVLTTPLEQLRAPWEAELRRFAVYETLNNGASPNERYTKEEVEELFGWVLEHIRYAQVDNEDETQEDQWDELLQVEEGDWSALEIQEQLQALGQALSLDWREELDGVLSNRRLQVEEHLTEIAQAEAHIQHHRLLGAEEIDRLNLYERQKLATYRHLLSMLERRQALRLGQPVAAPVALDVSLSAHEACH
jgi:hypothetical protein